MRYLSIGEVLTLYQRLMAETGGKAGIENLNALESSLAQPRMTFEGKDLYPTISDKAAILGYSLIKNHPFSDGNKRIGHASMEVFLLLNGLEIQSSVDEQETTILKIAAGEMSLVAFTDWIKARIVPYKS
ncbi:MAG: type II toxin-antitoxin system death-on-curing family toxin [Dehalococcoidia bacterium]